MNINNIKDMEEIMSELKKKVYKLDIYFNNIDDLAKEIEKSLSEIEYIMTDKKPDIYSSL